MTNSIIDYNVTKKTLSRVYDVNMKDLSNFDDKTMSEKMIEKLNYIYLEPEYDSIYPHANNKRFPSYNVNDRVFRNANSNIGLGYYSNE